MILVKVTTKVYSVSQSFIVVSSFIEMQGIMVLSLSQIKMSIKLEFTLLPIGYVEA
jgi:hypothetical protein